MVKDPKDPEDPQGGNPPGNPPGNPDPNVKALQQKLTEKDQLLKKALADIEELKTSKEKGTEETKTEIQKLTETVSNLTGQIEQINAETKKQELAKKYPDILPEFLLGKSDEEAEIIVEKQRKKIMENYDEKPSAHAPQFESRGDIDKAIKKVVEDKTMTIEDRMTKVRELKRIKEEL